MVTKSILYLATIAVLGLASAVTHGLIDSKIIYLLSDGNYIGIARIVAASVIALLVVIRPPRPILLRLVLAVLSVGVVSSALYATFTYQMGVLDTLLAMLVGVVFMIEAAELTDEDVAKSFSRRISRA